MIKINSVAVVIPFYNGSEYLERAVLSALNQTIKPSEIIVVDDGSDAKESKFASALSKKLKFTLITQKNGGQGSARNTGIRASKSEFICLLDQDDYFLEWHIEHLLKVTLKRKDERFAYSYGDLWRGNESGQVVFHDVIKRYSTHPKIDLYDIIGKDMHILPSASLISKKAFLDIGGFDERLIGYEDDDLFLRFFINGYTSVYTPKAVTFWTINRSSTTFSVKMTRSKWIYFNKLCDSIEDDYFLGNLVFRDLLLPRFLDSFIGDFIKGVISDSPHFDEYQERLLKLRKMILDHKTTSHYRRILIVLDFFGKAKRSSVLRVFALLSAPVLTPIAKLGKVHDLANTIRHKRQTENFKK